jgi:uncharacterized protein (DUF4415 family)
MTSCGSFRLGELGVKNEKLIVSVSERDLKRGRTDWEALAALSDEDIERAIAEDPDSAPPLAPDWIAKAVLVIPPAKTATSIRVDNDVMDWFKAEGRGWQTRMNAVLRAYAKAHGGVR